MQNLSRLFAMLYTARHLRQARVACLIWWRYWRRGRAASDLEFLATLEDAGYPPMGR